MYLIKNIPNVEITLLLKIQKHFSKSNEFLIENVMKYYDFQ